MGIIRGLLPGGCTECVSNTIQAEAIGAIRFSGQDQLCIPQV